MLEYELQETGPNPEYCVIWMHGLGADGNDFAPIVPQFDLPTGAAVRFIFPHAPQMPVTINGGYVMRAWYDIVAPDLTARQDQAGIMASEKLIMEIIDNQINSGIATEKMIIAGFSQGGAMSLHIGLRGQHKFAGIMALSCYLPLMEETPIVAAQNEYKPNIFMAHGSFDPVVPMAAGSVSRQHMESMGYTINWHEYPMEHNVCSEEIDDIGMWISKIIDEN